MENYQFEAHGYIYSLTKDKKHYGNETVFVYENGIYIGEMYMYYENDLPRVAEKIMYNYEFLDEVIFA